LHIQKPLLSQGSGYTSQSGVLTSGWSWFAGKVIADAAGLIYRFKIIFSGAIMLQVYITVMAGDEKYL
jgi:hypothetical protein